MSNKEPNDTDLTRELVKEFGKNQGILKTLVEKVNEMSANNLDITVQVKLRELRKTILVEDVKGQDHKIELITNVLDSLCSPVTLPKG